MVKYWLILLLPFCMRSQVMWQIKKDTVQKWYYEDGDEFNAYSVDTGRWRSGMPWGNFVISQDFYFSKNNIRQQSGIISFDAKKEKLKFPVADHGADLQKSGKKTEDGQFEVEYTCGMISSLRRYKYGVFELRFKSTANTGIWPAFWLFGGEPNEEIDLFELKGERKAQVHVDVHCPDGCENYHGGFLNLQRNWGGWVNVQKNLADGWNILSGEWQPDYVKWFLNGQPIAYFKGDFKTSQYVLINTSVAKTGGAFPPGPDGSTQWPNHFDVDYLRIWSKEDTLRRRPWQDAFEQSPATIDSARLYNTFLKKKLNYVYNKKALGGEFGTITLLPAGMDRYSLSLAGPELGPVKIGIYNSAHEKQKEVTLENMQYYTLDLHDLPKGVYQVGITVKGHTLTQEIAVTGQQAMPH